MALITPTQVIDIAFTNKNTDKYLVKPAFIEIAELNFIQPVVGEELFQKLKDDSDNGVALSSSPIVTSLITPQAAYTALHHKYFTIYSQDNAIKFAVYFQVTSTDVMGIPPNYDDVIPVDLSATGASSTKAEVAAAIHTAINGNPNFTSVMSGTDAVRMTVPTGATEPSNKTTTSISFSLGGDFNITSGSSTITCTANDYIQVGDFVSGEGLPIREDGTGSCKPFNVVKTVNTPGAVTSFTVSGTPIATNAAADLRFQRPNGKLINDYIVNYLAFCVKFEMLPDISYNTTSQGIVENVGEFTMPVDAKKLNFLRNETFKKSESYSRKMIKFLEDNDASYPDYCNEKEGGVSKKNGIILY
jgi:hypothetical protein